MFEDAALVTLKTPTLYLYFPQLEVRFQYSSCLLRGPVHQKTAKLIYRPNELKLMKSIRIEIEPTDSSFVLYLIKPDLQDSLTSIGSMVPSDSNEGVFSVILRLNHYQKSQWQRNTTTSCPPLKEKSTSYSISFLKVYSYISYKWRHPENMHLRKGQ